MAFEGANEPCSRRSYGRMERSNPRPRRGFRDLTDKSLNHRTILMRQQPPDHLGSELHRVFADQLRGETDGTMDQVQRCTIRIPGADVVELQIVEADGIAVTLGERQVH